MDSIQTLRVITFKEGDTWVAQAIEHDISVQAPSEEMLVQRFELTLMAEIRESEERGDEAPLSGLRAAPHRFRDLWIKAGSKTVKSFTFDGHDVDMALCA